MTVWQGPAFTIPGPWTWKSYTEFSQHSTCYCCDMSKRLILTGFWKQYINENNTASPCLPLGQVLTPWPMKIPDVTRKQLPVNVDQNSCLVNDTNTNVTHPKSHLHTRKRCNTVSNVTATKKYILVSSTDYPIACIALQNVFSVQREIRPPTGKKPHNKALHHLTPFHFP